MVWDLSPLVESTDLDKIKKRMFSLIQEAKRINSEYKGKITSLDAEGLLAFIKRLEKHRLNCEGTLKYCFLRYAANTLDPEAKQINDLARTSNVKIRQALAFAEIEVAHLVEKKSKLIEKPQLAQYNHYLSHLQRKAPHYLSDVEEQLIIQKDRFGIDSWSQLHGNWISSYNFEIEIDGQTKRMPYGEIVALYEHPDRNLRKEVNRIVYKILGQDKILWASALRAIIGDHVDMSKLRKWPSSQTQSLIDNDIDIDSLSALMTTVENHVEVYHQYLHLKASLMKLPKLSNYDLFAPLPNMPDRVLSWEEASKVAIETYSIFDPEMGSIVANMFNNRRIDGAVRKGKQSGAYCYSWLAGHTAFIRISFNGRLGELFTLIHENGHAVHCTLSSQQQSVFNCDVGMCVAEISSMFGELLLADKLIQEAKIAAEKIEVLAKILDELGLYIFQISARYFFEMSLYEAFERGEYLDEQTITKLWIQARNRIFSDTVDWSTDLRWGWTTIWHYYIPRFRLYNYPYVFATLFALALYRLYKEQGIEFVPKLKKLLSAGGSRSPQELAGNLGFDITTPEFWALGFKQVEEFVNLFESLIERGDN